MKIKEGFELREICGEQVILSHGMNNVDFSKIISLNDTAAFLWKTAAAMPEFNETDLVKALTDTYNVSADEAQCDVHRTVGEWKEIGLAE